MLYCITHFETINNNRQAHHVMDNLVFSKLENCWNFIESTIKDKYMFNEEIITYRHPHMFVGSEWVGVYFYDDGLLNPSESHVFNIVKLQNYEDLYE